MLVLQANEEQEQTFQKLIQTMGEQIVWNGRFIVKDDELILEGAVRSLIFQFDTKKVFTDLVDIPVREEQVLDISRHPTMKDLINMVLYAFGKWGMLRGLRVQHDYPQLNELFGKILGTFYIEPSFRKENFRFYKVGVRITYEEVMATVLEYEKKQEDDPRAESQGLWHRLIWKNREKAFHKQETTLLERVEDRIGNNFYLVGYQCPSCSEKLHMVVYPEGKEVRIDTEEKGVYMARCYTCSKCNCFYTPRPNRLIAEGIIYEMDFGDDTKAYEDYLELLGYYGDRTSNYQYNEYEAVRRQRQQQEAQEENASHAHGYNPDILNSPQDALRQMEDYGVNFAALPDAVFNRFAHRIEEGFYPDAAVAKHEKKILQEVKEREEKQIKQEKDKEQTVGVQLDNMELDESGQAQYLKNAQAEKPAQEKRLESVQAEKSGQAQRPETMTLNHEAKLQQANRIHSLPEDKEKEKENAPSNKARADKNPGTESNTTVLLAGHMAKQRQQAAAPDKKSAQEEKLERYEKRVGMLERLSERQKQELKKQIQYDTAIDGAEKTYLLGRIEEAELKETSDALQKKIEQSANKNYMQIQKMILEAEKGDYPESLKGPYIKELQNLRKLRGEEEVRQIMDCIPERMDRAGYQKLEKQLQAYEHIDLSPYESTLRQKREAAEKQEIANIVKRARKTSRSDYVSLMRRLEDQQFADENITPYMDKVKEKIRTLDEERLDQLVADAQTMDFNDAAAIYEQIDDENFLPELKSGALEMLAKRLEKIRTDECELLVKKLQEEMKYAIKDNARHHFYPARKVMLNTAEPAETSAINAALSAYANDRSMFEYPIFSVDTSRNHSGREGMLLTPENLFYSTRMHAYGIPISDIASIEASTGILNRKISLLETNGAEHKLPYAVKTTEMEKWADILEDFIHYLQEKPASRKLKYLAKETHDTICCYRCGYVYHGRDVCPECGYKKNR